MYLSNGSLEESCVGKTKLGQRVLMMYVMNIEEEAMQTLQFDNSSGPDTYLYLTLS